MKYDILQEIGDLYIAKKNEELVGPGSVFLIPKHRFPEYLRAVGISEAEMKGINFMGIPIFPGKHTKDEIIFVASQFEGIQGVGSEGGLDIHPSIFKAYQDKLNSMREELKKNLENEGISFQNEESFANFCKTQLTIQEKGRQTIISHEGKVIMQYTTKFDVSEDEENKSVTITTKKDD